MLNIIKGRSITIFEIIHQGPQDTIIFYIQNKLLSMVKKSMLLNIPMEPHF